jgi:NAD(P)-dependent dehydrogenase (short-subunit alcohol dehydrogenase family)
MATAHELFAGEVAVVTGAGSGIGEAIARHAAQLGMRLVLADIAEDRLDAVVRDLAAAGGTALGIATDVTDAAAVNRLAQRAYDAFGSVCLLANVAGAETVGTAWDTPPEDFDRVMQINLYGVYHGIRAFVPRMLAAGRPAYVVTVTSLAALMSLPVQAAYAASKHAAQSLVESLYLDLQVRHAPIHVATVVPALVRTRIFDDARSTDEASAIHEQLRRTAADALDPADVAAAVFEGLVARRFWIVTHAEQTETAAVRRAEMITALSPPELAGPLGAAAHSV